LDGRNAMQRLLVACLSAAMVAALGLGPANAADKKALAFVVNGASDFWKIAEAGVKKAQGELPKYDLQFKYPEQATAAVQQRILDDLVAAGAAELACVLSADGLVVEVGDVSCGSVDAWEEAA